MNYRRFGRLGWQVGEMGYGMWGMGGWTGSDDAESMASLQRSLDLGVNFFDTAWGYGSGHSERLLAKLIAANPNKQVYVATKIPPKDWRWPSRHESPLDDCFPPDHIEEYVRKSAENLAPHGIDLIQLHTWEDTWMKDDRWIRKIRELQAEGLFRSVGISLNSQQPWNGIEAVRSGLIDAVQVVYNIFEQCPEDQLFPACAENDVAVIARVPFDEGSLTGTLALDSRWPEGDFRNAYFGGARLAESVKRADALKALLPADMTLPEMALRFILNAPEVSTIIPGMRKLRNVEANIRAGNAGRLPPKLQAELRHHRWDRAGTP